MAFSLTIAVDAHGEVQYTTVPPVIFICLTPNHHMRSHYYFLFQTMVEATGDVPSFNYPIGLNPADRALHHFSMLTNDRLDTQGLKEHIGNALIDLAW